MKSAEEWQEELAGETSIESIRQIQSDALLDAAHFLHQQGHEKLAASIGLRANGIIMADDT